MTETPETPAAERAKAEAAATRRRWITLGELLAVLAVVISALTLWNNYSERAHQEADRSASASKAAQQARTLLLRSQPADGGRRLDIQPVDRAQTIQSMTILFPTALDTTPAETTGDARIEADWFGDALRRARKAKGRPDSTKGDERLPVAITTRYLADGDVRTDVAIYNLGYVLEGRLLGGSTVRLRGLSLVERTSADKAQKQLDRLWDAR
jgi:hypothetical protein